MRAAARLCSLAAASASPPAAKPNAVEGCMATRPGSTVFSTAMSRAQPAKTASPSASPAAPQSRAVRSRAGASIGTGWLGAAIMEFPW